MWCADCVWTIEQVPSSATPVLPQQSAIQSQDLSSQAVNQILSACSKQPVTASISLPVTCVALNPTVKTNLDDSKQELDKIHTSNSSHNLKAELEANLKEIFAPTSNGGTATPSQTITNSAASTQTVTDTTNSTTNSNITEDVNQEFNDSELRLEDKSTGVDLNHSFSLMSSEDIWFDSVMNGNIESQPLFVTNTRLPENRPQRTEFNERSTNRVLFECFVVLIWSLIKWL